MLKKKECCVVTIVSLSRLKGMCTFSSSAQHDIVYLYNDVSIKCTLLFSVVGYIIGYKVQCNNTLGDYRDCYCSSNWINYWYMVNSMYN